MKIRQCTQTLRVANSVCRNVHIKGGNCHREEKRKLDLAQEIEEGKLLPKRARRSSILLLCLYITLFLSCYYVCSDCAVCLYIT